MAELKIKGLEKLEHQLKQNRTLDDVKNVVRKNGADLQRNIKKKAEFKQGYQTGQTRRSVNLELKDNGFTAESGPTTEYAPYLEYGTRFMEAQPFVKPAYEKQREKFLSDMKELVR